MININDINSVKKYNWGPYFNYQVTLKSGGISGVPNDTNNVDCVTVLEWEQREGNTIEE